MLLGRGRRKIKSPFPILPLLCVSRWQKKEKGRRGPEDGHTQNFSCASLTTPTFPRKEGKKKALPPKGRQGWAGGLPLPTFFFVLLPFSWNESPEINKFLGCTVHNRVTVVNVLGESLTRKKEGGKGRECASRAPLFFYHPAPAPLSRNPFFFQNSRTFNCKSLFSLLPILSFMTARLLQEKSPFLRASGARVCRTIAKQQEVCQVYRNRAAAKIPLQIKRCVCSVPRFYLKFDDF